MKKDETNILFFINHSLRNFQQCLSFNIFNEPVKAIINPAFVPIHRSRFLFSEISHGNIKDVNFSDRTWT